MAMLQAINNDLNLRCLIQRGKPVFKVLREELVPRSHNVVGKFIEDYAEICKIAHCARFALVPRGSAL
jgi:hypothetical protein